MKIQFQTGTKQFSADIDQDGDKLDFRPDGVSGVQLDIRDLGEGRYVVVINGQVFRCSYEKGPGSHVVVNGKWIPIETTDDRKLSHGSGGGASAGGRINILSPMPGKVVNVLCAEGDEVAEGQGIIVVEAMKMQNELAAPRAGKVIEIRGAAGQTVNAGEILAVLE